MSYAKYFRRRADEHKAEADKCRLSEAREGHWELAEIYRSLAEYEDQREAKPRKERIVEPSQGMPVMSIDEFKAILEEMDAGNAAEVPYEIYEELFPPGEPDESARQRAYEFAKANGCVIDHRPTERLVLFVKSE